MDLDALEKSFPHRVGAGNHDLARDAKSNFLYRSLLGCELILAMQWIGWFSLKKCDIDRYFRGAKGDYD